MGTATTMTYGGYAFEPIPLITINKEFIKSEDGTPVNELTRITMNGTLVATSHLIGPNGLDKIDTQIEALRDAFRTDCLLFEVKCDTTNIIQAYPRINNIEVSESPDNWTQTAPFTIELEFETEIYETNNYPDNVKSASEEWQLEFSEENPQYTETLTGGTLDATPYVLRLTHTVSAQGMRTCVSGGSTSGSLDKFGWQEAQDYVVGRIGYDSGVISSGMSGVFNINPSGLGRFNHMRSKTMDELNGNFGVTETWLLLETGLSGLAGNALEDFTVTLRTDETDPNTVVTVEGTIRGLETRDYGTNPGDFAISQEKYAAALAYWTTVESRLYARCNTVAGSLARPLSTTSDTSSVGHNKSRGVITYSQEFNNELCFLTDSGTLAGQVLDEIITISDNNPTDIFAKVAVLGRAAGPVLQEISTVSEKTRDISIEMLVIPPTACDLDAWITLGNTVKTNVNEILCRFENDLKDESDQVFKHVDTQSWIPQQGRYTRQIGWTHQSCSGTGATSIC